jgi:hypothetical protein
MDARDSRRRAAAVVLVAPLVLCAAARSAHAQGGAAQAEDGSKTTPLPAPGDWVGPFPIPSGATQDPKQSGMTSLGPGRNYVFAVYTIERPRAEIVRFYESTLKTYRRSEGTDGSVTLKTDEGSVRLTESGRQTRIRITHGPQ